MKANAHEPPT